MQFDKILLRDDQDNEYRPMDQRQLTDYWLSLVTIKLGNPITWTAQMDAVQKKEVKEKFRVEAVYTGGRLPSRSEHTGYIAFRDVSETGKPQLLWYQRNWARVVQFIALGAVGAAAAPAITGKKFWTQNWVRVAEFFTLGGLGLFIADRFYGPPDAVPIGRVQVLIEVATRDSQYGPPLSVTLQEFNFDMVKVTVPPKGDEEMDEWRAP